MFQHQPQQPPGVVLGGGSSIGGSSPARRRAPATQHHRPPPINTSHLQPAPSLRQTGRFLSSPGGIGTAGETPPSARRPGAGHVESGYGYEGGNPLSPTSTVRFQEENGHDGGRHEEENHGDHSPAFLFEKDDLSCSDKYDDENDLPERGGGKGGAGVKGPAILPSEAQLALLCLDYLRDLRRSYQFKEDLLNAEGLDADYIALAAWSLSRAFVRPQKLTHDEPRVSTATETLKKGHKVDTHMFGGGGLAGSPETDEPAGNDAWYRQLDEDVQIDERKRARGKRASSPRGGKFALSPNVSLPEMEVITDEILLRHPDEPPFGRGSKKNTGDDDDEDDEPFYEHNDAHPSNAHRFYLLNGLASDASSEAVEGLMTPRGLTPRGAPSDNAGLAVGGPLSFAEIVSAGLCGLGARSRVNADRDIVKDPLFRQFIQAASAGGFFQEKRGERKTSSKGADPPPKLSEEEENRHSRLLYEDKYRKVVNKFRTKLATNEARAMTPGRRREGEFLFGGSPRPSTARVGAAYRILSGNASVSSGGGGSVSSALAADNDVSERQRRRRERRIERVRAERRAEDEGLYGRRLLAKKKEALSVPRMNDDGADDEGGEGDAHGRRGGAARPPTTPRLSTPQSGRSKPKVDVGPRWTTPSPRTPSPKLLPSMQRTLASKQQPPSSIPSPERFKRTPSNISSTSRQGASTPTAIPSPERFKRTPSNISSTSRQGASTPTADTRSGQHPASQTKTPADHEAERLNTEGNALMQKKSFKKALETYTSALALSPSGPNSHVYYSNRSAAHLSMNDYDTSIGDSERSLALKPDYTKAHSRLGLAYFASGRYGLAVGAYKAALEIDPDSEWTKNHLQRAKEKLEESGKGLEESVVQKEREIERINDRATGEQGVAAGDDQTFMTEDSNWSTPFDERTKVGAQGEKVGDNKEDWDQEDRADVAECTRLADEHKDRGNALMSNKEYKKALAQYDLALEVSPMGPNSHVYYSNRAAAHCYLADYESATEDCRESIKLNPSYEKAHARLGLSLFFRGEYEDAIEAYETSLVLDPNNKASTSYLKKAKARLSESKGEDKERKAEDKEEREREQRKKEMEEATKKRMSFLKRQQQVQRLRERSRRGGVVSEAVVQERISEEGEDEEESSEVLDGAGGSGGNDVGIESAFPDSPAADEGGSPDVEERAGEADMGTRAGESLPQQKQEAFDPFVTTDK